MLGLVKSEEKMADSDQDGKHESIRISDKSWLLPLRNKNFVAISNISCTYN